MTAPPVPTTGISTRIDFGFYFYFTLWHREMNARAISMARLYSTPFTAICFDDRINKFCPLHTYGYTNLTIHAQPKG